MVGYPVKPLVGLDGASRSSYLRPLNRVCIVLQQFGAKVSGACFDAGEAVPGLGFEPIYLPADSVAIGCLDGEITQLSMGTGDGVIIIMIRLGLHLERLSTVATKLHFRPIPTILEGIAL